MNINRKYVGIGLVVSGVAIAVMLGAAHVDAHNRMAKGKADNNVAARMNVHKDDALKTVRQSEIERKHSSDAPSVKPEDKQISKGRTDDDNGRGRNRRSSDDDSRSSRSDDRHGRGSDDGVHQHGPGHE